VKGNLKTAFGKVIRQLRVERTLSQQEVAVYAGIDRSHISDLERGLYVPTLENVYKIAEVFKVKPSDLIDLVDKQLKIK
jgi:transcriptional regulator with XRE-family HTH domain